MARFTILIDVLGGLAIMLGAFMALFSVPMMALLLLATFTGVAAVRLQLDQVDRDVGYGAQFGPPG